MKIEANPSVADFFRTTIRNILRGKNLRVRETTEFYVVNLLAAAIQSHSENADPNYFEEPLAILFSKAFSTKNNNERYILLKHLGDQSLYISGFFGDSIKQKIIDIDYYISMGSNAYSQLSDISKNQYKDFFSETFDEIAANFPVFVDVISEVSEQAQITNNQDLLRLYERWLYTKSQRLLEKLQASGIHPQDSSEEFH